MHPVDEPVLEVVQRNIQALADVQKRREAGRTLQERIADAVTGFAGSMKFVALHALFFGSWLILNLDRVHILPHWDPYPFVMLAMIASVEAIFLSTFVLISQNRMSAQEARRAQLDLQINLLSEHEITRLLHMVDAIGARLGVRMANDLKVDDLKKDVPPEAVLQEIENVHSP